MLASQILSQTKCCTIVISSPASHTPLWRHHQNANRPCGARYQCVKIFSFIFINGLLISCYTWNNVSGLSGRTLHARRHFAVFVQSSHFHIKYIFDERYRRNYYGIFILTKVYSCLRYVSVTICRNVASSTSNVQAKDFDMNTQRDEALLNV